MNWIMGGREDCCCGHGCGPASHGVQTYKNFFRNADADAVGTITDGSPKLNRLVNDLLDRDRRFGSKEVVVVQN